MSKTVIPRRDQSLEMAKKSSSEDTTALSSYEELQHRNIQERKKLFRHGHVRNIALRLLHCVHKQELDQINETRNLELEEALKVKAEMNLRLTSLEKEKTEMNLRVTSLEKEKYEIEKTLTMFQVCLSPFTQLKATIPLDLFL